MAEMHQGLPVSGYQPQTEDKVALVNRNKEVEEIVLRIYDELNNLQFVDKRWLNAGKTDIEKGFMAINRAIFQPSRVDVSKDTNGLIERLRKLLGL